MEKIITYEDENMYGTIRKRKGAAKPLPPTINSPSPVGPTLSDSTPSKRSKKPLPRAPVSTADKENNDDNARPVSCSKIEKEDVRKTLPLPTSPIDAKSPTKSALSPKQRRISKGGKKSMSPKAPRPRIVSGRYDPAVCSRLHSFSMSFA